MRKVAAADARDNNLDTKRVWVRVECGNGHEAMVEKHAGGSEAVCDQCGDRFTYGGYVPPSVTPESSGEGVVDVVDVDAAASADKRG